MCRFVYNINYVYHVRIVIAAMKTLYLGMVNNKLNHLMREAHEVGYDLMFMLNTRGVEFELTGLSDSQIILRLLNVIFKSKF